MGTSKHKVLSYQILSHKILSRENLSHEILSREILSHDILSRKILSCKMSQSVAGFAALLQILLLR